MPGSTASRRRLTTALIVVLMAGLLLYGWHSSRTSEQFEQAPPLLPTAMTIVPGIHLLGGLEPAAAYVVDTSVGLVLIDAGVDDDAGVLKQQMAKLGLDWKRLRAIFLTHVHGDHSGGAEHLRQETGATVYAGAQDATILRAGKPRSAFFGSLLWRGKAHPTNVDVDLHGEERITIGNAVFHALASPGHSPGSVCYLLEMDGKRIFFSGDVIMSLSGHALSLSKLKRPLGTYAAYMSPRGRGDAAAFLGTLARLRALPAPDLVLPGHPRNDGTPQRPHLSRERWHALLDEGIADMKRLIARNKTHPAIFLDNGPEQLSAHLYYLGTLQDVPVYAFRDSTRLFIVNAPRGALLTDFVTSSLRKLSKAPASKTAPSAPTAVMLTSCGERETAGLADLLKHTRAAVVVARDGLATVRQLCPSGTRIIAADDLAEQGWFEAHASTLSGPGLGTVAYQVIVDNRKVLFSGGLPVPVHNERAARRLFADIESRQSIAEFLGSLKQLEKLSPDLWLPAWSLAGQDANLHDRDWREILEDNRDLVR